MKAPELKTDRLLLQPLTSAFLSEEYVSWLNDPLVNQYLETPSDYTLEDLQAYLTVVDKQDILFWAIVHQNDNKHIGNIKIDPVHPRDKRGEYGILMGNTEYWGKGYAKEASEAVIHYCFDELHLRKITLGVVENNITAVQLYYKIGFETEGIFRSHSRYNNDWCNVLRMARFNPKTDL